MNGRKDVPNVFYSCGAIIHNNSNFAYAVSDYSSTYAVVDLAELISFEKKSITAVKACEIL
jgi:predicted GH43/DUF377 family glycosyl hydrolase